MHLKIEDLLHSIHMTGGKAHQNWFTVLAFLVTEHIIFGKHRVYYSRKKNTLLLTLQNTEGRHRRKSPDNGLSPFVFSVPQGRQLKLGIDS